MDVCKWIVPSQHGGTRNSRRAASPPGLGSNPGEEMDVCKCIVPSQHGGTLNSRRAASPLVRLVEGNERWEAHDLSPGCSPPKLGWNQDKTYCHLYGAQGYGQRQAYIYPLL
ncbi:hypothetical protein TNCV_3376931 [Trichonephila clavipes]|nr:hypothetical protein TNCV_3376931 [Trichonephila clavipes]